MKAAEFHLREELTDQANALRVYRWFRNRGRKVKLRGKMARRVRSGRACNRPRVRRAILVGKG